MMHALPKEAQKLIDEFLKEAEKGRAGLTYQRYPVFEGKEGIKTKIDNGQVFLLPYLETMENGGQMQPAIEDGNAIMGENEIRSRFLVWYRDPDADWSLMWVDGWALYGE